jgi:hypothetical protein
MEKRSKKIMFIAVIAAIIVAVPTSFYFLSSYPITINPTNDCNTYYFNFTNFPNSASPLLVHPANLDATINETNHGPSNIAMNITGCISYASADDQMLICLYISFYGELSPSLHPTGMELRTNGSIGMSAVDYKCPFNNNISNVSFDYSYLNPQQTCLRNMISLQNDSRFLFFGTGSPCYHFRYSSEVLRITYAPPFNQTRVFNITLSLLGLQKPVYVEYRMVVTKT